MKKIAIINAPSVLGLRESGVEKLPEALKAHGLIKKLGAIEAGTIPVPPYDAHRDELTHVLNPQGIKDFSIKLADTVEQECKRGRFPFVLGGDCSIIIGCLLGLRRLGRYGLFFVDGHADFYEPEASLTGEVADMDLAIVTGRGPEILTNIEERKPLVEDSHVVIFGYRDLEEQKKYGSRDITSTNIYAIELQTIKKTVLLAVGTEALRHLLQQRSEGFWIHLDPDVLDDAIMPAVDYRQAGGLSFEELSDILGILLTSQKAVGMSVAIFNPTLDPDGSIAQASVEALVKGFQSC